MNNDLSSFAATPLLLVGCGKMGAALLRGWQGRGLPPNEVAVIQPSRAAAAEFADTAVVAHRGDLPPAFAPRTVVLAMRPQQLDEATPPLANLADFNLVSVLAGTSVSRLRETLPGAASVVRAMPNLAVEVLRGVTTLFADNDTAAVATENATLLFSALGDVVRLDDEEHLELATALAGSGPAYVFLLARALEDGAVELGMSREAARALSRGMIAGSGELLCRREEESAALVREVAVRGGVTDAALSSGLGEALPRDILEALRAGVRRARELRGD
ncbi:MAG: pyrroline-5-carboxylate reductase [Alphaproteobacteria bacterium]|nr:pyrroline-5-carboxylate reductase [Alphaproteobacteria bacterium]MDA8004858.1 pyrroline-5-carboxylate reductase [Alphaproteobacteria bacterium]MDA8005741.1 pyrroline-5-carboxylate reductase [Alphaproteobacteria bacterium]MDA8013110.1 pyrroline-5-carboxylate reductase [Alphaproteobacteria bacterium]